MIRKLLSSTWFFLTVVVALGQAPKKYHVGEIRQMLEKLNVLGTVLYVAAHPDDENTLLITYYANAKHYRTAYLSATRGDGGQNLIGTEIRESLGLIRTHELQAARKTDGGQQFFSRANDFGYSKHPDETFTIWDKQKVLEDFVWTYRKFRPDVIITRFNKKPGTTHGHHTASAILAHEAFSISNKPDVFPHHLDYVSTWQPKRIYWNTGWWWFRAGYDTTGLAKVNVGDYNPLLGKSYNEISAESRSMHKSQGFGSAGSRGMNIEYLKQWDGDPSRDPFKGIDTNWSRVKGSEQVQFFVNKAINEFDETNPSKIVPQLVLARKELMKLSDDFWKPIKLNEIDELIKAVTGLYIEIVSNEIYYAPGDSVDLKLEAINRSSHQMKLKEVNISHELNPIVLNLSLNNNRPITSEISTRLPNNMIDSNPYWLNEKGSLGMYSVSDQLAIGKPENDPAITCKALIQIGDEMVLEYEVPVLFKKVDRVKGEVYQPLTVGPPVTINLDSEIQIFGEMKPKKVVATLSNGSNSQQGKLMLNLPEGWQVSPESIDFKLALKGEEKQYEFEITPPKNASNGMIDAVAIVDGEKYRQSKILIDYDHIPTQFIFPKAQMKVVRIPLEKKGQNIGYIMGAGDLIPENLKNIGYTVSLLEKDNIDATKLALYDAVIVGIRAFNTKQWLTYKNEELFKYAENGGTVIVQYNTTRGLLTSKVAPYDLKLSRDRVAVENAPVKILTPNHPVISGPNKISSKDFEGWVQERGLYFPDEWSDEFTPILSSNDPGESAKEGGLLIAKHGKGYYVYSGYSWFRELPAGVPGAYRLFVNIISLGK